MKQIQLANGKGTVTVDDQDYEHLSRFKWHMKEGYASRASSRRDGPRRQIKMHREILWVPRGMEIDHRNGNKLDNRRSNLRACTHAENTRNKPAQANSKSGVRGVSWHKGNSKWRAQICVSGQDTLLGYFDDVAAATAVYDKAARELHGEFAHPNRELPAERLMLNLSKEA